jgi:hypothetical protein
MSPAVGEVQADRVLVAQQLKDNELAMASSGAEFERRRQAEIDRRLDSMAKSKRAIFDDMEEKKLLSRADAERGREAVDRYIEKLRNSDDTKNWDFRAYLQEERSQLLADQAMALQIVGQDIEYHRARGVPYAGGTK